MAYLLLADFVEPVIVPHEGLGADVARVVVADPSRVIVPHEGLGDPAPRYTSHRRRS